jgi:hypothetical protein
MQGLRFCQLVVPRRHWRLGALVGVLFAATTAVQSAQLSAPPPPAAPKPPKEQIAKPELPPAEPTLQAPIELLASRPIIRLMINGQGPVAFLIDPLAPRVLIDPTLVESLALKAVPNPAGRAEVRIDIGLGSASFPGVVAEVANTGRLVPEIGPAGQPRGVLNALLWKDHLLTIDIGNRKLRIEPGALPEPDDKHVFALENPSGDLLVPLKMNGQSLVCRIDPAASHGLLLPSSYLEQATIQGAARVGSRIQVRDGVVMGKEVRLATKVTIAAFEFDQPIVDFVDVGDLAIMGNRWLVDFALTYDVANGRVRLGRRSVS